MRRRPTFKLRLRTGGSSANVKKHFSTKEESGMRIDMSSDKSGRKMRLPFGHRYRSPIFVDFYASGSRKPDAYAALWLLELTDGKKFFDILIFSCDNGLRLSQNYITQDNFREIPETYIEEVGRVHFKGRFSAGTDLDHVKFVSDNDSRETIESWEACYAEGVRQQEEVQAEVPPLVQKLHDQSLTHGRDVLAQADEKEREKWLAKDGTDWSGAFGKDPKELMTSKSRESWNEEQSDGYEEDEEDEEDDDEDCDGDGPDLGIQEGRKADLAVESNQADGAGRVSINTETTDGTVSEQSRSKNPIKAYKEYKSRSRDLHRKHRGLMQWRPMRNAQFAKNDAKFAFRKVKNLGALDGRHPDVETEV